MISRKPDVQIQWWLILFCSGYILKGALEVLIIDLKNDSPSTFNGKKKLSKR